MKILRDYVQSLTCVEVLEILKEPIQSQSIQPSQFSKGKRQEKLATQVYQVKKYLQEPIMPSSVFKKKEIMKLRLKKLTKLEFISIIDTRPISLVELTPIIEESDRFTDQELIEMIQELDKILPFKRPEQE